jgi:SAM-dependent methyltransferase
LSPRLDVTTPMLGAEDLRRFCHAVITDPSDLDRMMIGEAAFGLTRVLPVLEARRDTAPRVLEVGAGPLILAAYLACRGVDITAVEPALDHFEAFIELQHRMIDAVEEAGARLRVVRVPIEQFVSDETYDVVFTVNALEHMPDPLRAIDVMYGVLGAGGELLAHCPNYDVPFDSHFALVLLTRSKRINEAAYRRRIEPRRLLWDGLTFIRQSAVRRHCARAGYDVRFDRGMLRLAVSRLGGDALFSDRMPWLLRAGGRAVADRRLAALLTRVPLRYQTPMEFVIRK